VLVPRNLPESLRSLALERRNNKVWMPNYRYTPGIELVECLSLISRTCPVLERLTIESKLIIDRFPFASATTKDPYVFKSKFKIFLIYK